MVVVVVTQEDVWAVAVLGGWLESPVAKSADGGFVAGVVCSADVAAAVVLVLGRFGLRRHRG